MEKMSKYTIQTEPLGGFVAEAAQPGEDVKILIKCELITSDAPMFHIYMKHISGTYLAKTPVPLVLIHKFLILLHSDNTADIYINDFTEKMRVQVKDTVKAGELLYRSNISDISDLAFVDIDIKHDDAVIYGLRTDWRFSLYFDFTRKIDMDTLTKELGALKKDAELHSFMISADSVVSRLSTLQADALIFTEGKSDWKHLKKAAARLTIQRDLRFFESDTDRGSRDLLQMCAHYAQIPQSMRLIFVFDRDEDAIITKLKNKEKEGSLYQDWGNNVYSLYLPVPPHRSEDQYGITIEFFYEDDVILQEDTNGRRLYLNSEFDKKSGKHLSEPVNCIELGKIRRDKTCVIDDNVFDKSSHNIALPKDDFAEYVFTGEGDFAECDFTHFGLIFDAIDSIIQVGSK